MSGKLADVLGPVLMWVGIAGLLAAVMVATARATAIPAAPLSEPPRPAVHRLDVEPGVQCWLFRVSQDPWQVSCVVVPTPRPVGPTT